MKWVTKDIYGNEKIWISSNVIDKIKTFCLDEINYFNYDDEMQADWKALLESIERWEDVELDS